MMSFNMVRVHWLVAMVAALATAGLLARDASAQNRAAGDEDQLRHSGGVMGAGPLGLSESFVPEFVRRDVETFVEMLALDEHQRIVVENLVADYGAAFEASVQNVQARIAALRPNAHVDADRQRKLDEVRAEIDELLMEQETLRDAEQTDEADERMNMIHGKIEELQGVLRELRPQPVTRDQIAQMLEQASAIAIEWRAERDQLGEQLRQNARALLNDSQVQRWPALDYRLRREKTLGRGKLSGESIDLFAIVREVGIEGTDREVIAADLAGYEVELDEALRRRNRVVEETEPQVVQAMQAGTPEAAKAALLTQMSARMAVRDVNERYASQLSARVGGETGTSLLTTYKQRAYPRVYRSTPVHRALSAARRIDGLPVQTVTAIEQIEKSYEDELAIINPEIEAVIRQFEPEQMSRQFVSAGQRTSTGLPIRDGQPDEIRLAFEVRNAAGERTMVQLKSLLTEEQFAQLPGSTWLDQRAHQRESDEAMRRLETRVEFIRHFDSDGDGKLSEGERQAAKEFIRVRGGWSQAVEDGEVDEGVLAPDDDDQ